MTLKRRDFINLSVAAGTGIISGFRSVKPKENNTELFFGDLENMTDEAVPISIEERKTRIKKAQHLMAEQKIGALLLDAGTSMDYFTGIKWGQSERTLAAVIPVTGEVKYVCPGFEESRFRELIQIGKDVYVWQEDESPYKQIANAIKDSGIRTSNIGIEERVRFFIFDGVRKVAPQFNYVSGDPISAPCRMIKSSAEIALMQKANDITVAAIKAGISSLKEGMSQGEVASVITNVQRQLSKDAGFALVLFGQASAFPHGTTHPQKLKKGDIVLMDCGCQVEGYNSDITRTVVFGEPTKRQLEIWNLEKRSQAAGFAAAKLGHACGEVDAAARKVITDAGFGPGYKLPGLPHRTGHGIGMDGHEWGNMVKGNQQLLQPGMCFSVEPTISVPGEFGVRLEDCVYMTETGAKWFSPVAASIDQPFS